MKNFTRRDGRAMSLQVAVDHLPECAQRDGIQSLVLSLEFARNRRLHGFKNPIRDLHPQLRVPLLAGVQVIDHRACRRRRVVEIPREGLAVCVVVVLLEDPAGRAVGVVELARRAVAVAEEHQLVHRDLAEHVVADRDVPDHPALLATLTLSDHLRVARRVE